METAAIAYRVADFLKTHPPFHAVAEADLVALAARGRVRFHEGNEFILWQGEPHRAHVFVIQQGSVSLWEEVDKRAELRDIRGPGDMLGIERFNGAPCCLHSARAGGDVVLYTFPAEDFAALLDKYPNARHYVAAHDSVVAGYQPMDPRVDVHRRFIHDLPKRRERRLCSRVDSVRDLARRMSASGESAVAVADGERLHAIVSVQDLLGWIASGGGDVDQPIERLLLGPPGTIAADATVAEALLTMASSNRGALAITADGTSAGRPYDVVTAKDLAPFFGDNPASILSDIDVADGVGALAALTERARAFTLRHLTGPTAVDWLVRFVQITDARMVERILALTGATDAKAACWCFCGAAGRGETLTSMAPWPVVVLPDGADRDAAVACHRRVVDALAECGYISPAAPPFDQSFYVADATEWKARYVAWIRDPMFLDQLYKSRPLFDLRAVHGDRSIWNDVAATVHQAVDHEFLHILANDCLANLPPLSFFQDAVVEDTGDLASVFRLEESVLGPLVDVGRVFGFATGTGLGRSTLDRLGMARIRFPEHEAIFRDAAEALGVVLWQQGRVGISERTDGAELPPTLLSRHDRHLLKATFRPILRLIEFTADRAWISGL